MKPILKIVKGTLLALLGLIMLCVLVPLLVALLYQDQLKASIRSVFTSRSEQVLSDFSVSLSVLQHFPYATFTVRDISISDTSLHRPIEVLGARKVQIKANLYGLFHGTVHVKGVEVEGARFYHGVNAAGQLVAFRLKPVNEKPSENHYSIEAPEVSVRNVDLTVENQYKGNRVALSIQKADLKMDITEDVLSIQGPITGILKQVRSKKLVVFQNQPFTTTAAYAYHLRTNTGRLAGTDIKMPHAHILVTGSHTNLPGRAGATLDFRLSGQVRTGDLLHEALPVQFRSYFDSTDIHSQTQFEYRVQGETGPVVWPHNVLSFKIASSKITWPKTRAQLQDLTLEGVFDNGEAHTPQTSSIRIHKLRARAGKALIQARFYLTDFIKPQIEGVLAGTINVKAWAAILQLPHFDSFAGTVQLNLAVKGPAHQLTEQYRRAPLVWNGTMQLRQVAFRPAVLSVPCTDLNGTVQFTNSHFHTQDLTGKLGGNRFQLSAQVQDLLKYWVGLSKTVTAHAELQSDGIHSDWLSLPDSAAIANDSAVLPQYLQLTSTINCRQVFLAKDTLRNLAVRVQGTPAYIRLSDISLNALNGYITGNATFPNDRNKLADAQVQLFAQVKELDLRKPLAESLGGRTTASNQGTRLGEKIFSRHFELTFNAQTVKLPSSENLNQLSVRMEKNGDQIKLTGLHCTTSSGGKISGTGRAVFQNGQFTQPNLNLEAAYDYLDLKKLIGLFTVLSQEEYFGTRPTAVPVRSGKPLPASKYRINVEVTANQLFYEALTGNNFNLKATVQENDVHLNQFSMQAFNGKLTSTGTLTMQPGAKLFPLQLQAQLQQMDLRQVFTAVDLLGLDLLNSSNIRGNVNCSMFIRTSLDQTSFLPSIDRTVMYTQASLKNLELIEVEAIQKALHFLSEKKTGHLYFEDVHTQFLLHDNQFVVPGTSLNSNLSYLYLSGTYTMASEADLHFDVGLLDVLFGNNKRRVEKLIQDQELAKPRIIKHLALKRQEGQYQYKLKLYNKQENWDAKQQTQEIFRRLIQQQRIDTTFSSVPRLLGNM